MEQDYLIAGHRIRVKGERLVQAIDALTGFTPFKIMADGEPLCHFVESTTEAPLFETVLYTNEIDGIVSHFGRYNNGFLFVMLPPEGEALELWLDENKQVASFKGNYNLRLLRFACWIAYGVATIPFQTVAIHTSTIVCRNKAILFLGESGTGKSTHTRLWRENIQGAVLLNDDSPILRIINGEPWIYGSPWSGKTPCYKNESYPLAACIRLSQAPFNQIKKLSVVQGYGALHPSCPPDFAYSDELYDYISSALSSLLSAVPVYHLACLPDADAAYLSHDTIFGTM
ncbi:hypothetical protein DWW10_18180 [Bacteroides intestinalis]|uniref:Phosphoenolpyruvate carboxykinase n=1 Tax=Bacteroides intestinalis TaxID=329854 RepID=A0A412XYG6_9BACE|nr:hypothetical protein [Bacteroides intestinalis]RGV50246.1 hypothetical protein DWW10_18180 [Bacteroides intestinalis]RHA56455.1 hypothetical protein DW932_19195 [Bacteroides intestinalis]